MMTPLLTNCAVLGVNCRVSTPSIDRRAGPEYVLLEKYSVRGQELNLDRDRTKLKLVYPTENVVIARFGPVSIYLKKSKYTSIAASFSSHRAGFWAEQSISAVESYPSTERNIQQVQFIHFSFIYVVTKWPAPRVACVTVHSRSMLLEAGYIS
jgi:hypothetical protein